MRRRGGGGEDQEEASVMEGRGIVILEAMMRDDMSFTWATIKVVANYCAFIITDVVCTHADDDKGENNGEDD